MSETGSFYISEHNEYFPDYGDIQWADRLQAVMAEHEYKPKPAVWFMMEDYSWQITPENAMYWNNAVAPEFDLIELYDLRPGEEDAPFHFYRATTPTFDQILDLIYPDWCQEIRRPIPSQGIVLNGLKRFTKDVRKALYVPEGW